MDRDRLDRWCVRMILGIMAVILIFGPLATGSVRPQDFLVIQWLTLAMCLVWLARLLLKRGLTIYWPPVCWLILAFLIYAWSRYKTADIEFIARQEFLHFLVYCLVFLVVLQNLRGPSQSRMLVLVAMGVGLFVSLYAVVQYLTGSDLVWHFHRPTIYARRGSGTYINPNHLAGYLAMVFPLALVCAVGGRYKVLTRVIIGYAALVIFLGILVSFSRGGWLAAAAGTLPLFFWLFAKRGYRIQGLAWLAAIVVIGVIFFAKSGLSPNRKGELHAMQQGENIRLLLWKPTLKMLADQPLWGVGPDHFDARFRAYRPEHKDLQVSPVRVHNDYLNLLVDWGLAGGMIVFLALAWFAARVWRGRSRFLSTQLNASTGDGPDTTVLLGAILGLVAIAVHSLFDFNMYVPANGILTAALFAVAIGQMEPFDGRVICRRRPWLRLGLVAGISLVLGYLGMQTWERSGAMLALLKSESHQTCSDEQVALLKEAYEREPKNFETAFQIGECMRLRSWQSGPSYREQARDAIAWFELSMSLNPHDPYSRVRKGMSLDWLNEHEAAEIWFLRALELDPNGYYINALVGWHYLQARQYAEAKKWLERSLRLFPNADNFVASYYLGTVHKLMAEEKDRL